MGYLYDIGIRFLVAAIVGALIPLSISFVSYRSDWKINGTLLTTLALVGASAGIAGGMSRTGVVGDIVPAFLGLLGAVAVYLFGVDRSKGVIASFGAVALSISLVSGYGLSAEYRATHISDYREIRAICATAYSDADLLSDSSALDTFESKLGEFCKGVLKWHLPE